MTRLVGAWWVCALCFGFGCGDDDSGAMMDAGADAVVVDDGGADASVDAFVEPPDPLPQDPAFDDAYTGVGDERIVTTLSETYAPRFGWELYVERNLPRVPLEEYGVLHPQPGEPHMVRDQLALPAGVTIDWTPGALPDAARSALHTFVFGDPQIVDVDSPSLQPKNNAGGLPAYRPWGEIIPQMGDALMRAANAFHEQYALDAVIVVGDAIENAQENELDWFLTSMNGGEIQTDSGSRDDVVPGPGNDAYDPFVAAGVPDGVPWVNIAGNHDVLVNGNFPPGLITAVNDSPEAIAALSPLLRVVGLTLPNHSTGTEHRGYLVPENRAMFVVDTEAFDLSQIQYRAAEFRGIPAAEVEADPARATVDICSYVAAHRDATGLPAGHGFPDDGGACEARIADDPTAPAAGWFTWDVTPVLRVVALALGPVEGGAEGILARPPIGCMVGGEPCRDDPRYDQIAFLETELERAASENVGVIVMSHQSSQDIVTEPALNSYRSFIEDNELLIGIWNDWVPTPNEPMSAPAFRRLLASSGVVVAHLAGHNHRHQVRAICANGTFLDGSGDGRCAPGADDETGYWEVTTTGAVDFPHQGRFFEVVHVGGTLGAIYLTVQDMRLPADSLTRRGRFISRAYLASTRGDQGGLAEADDRNLLLPFVLNDGVAAAWTAAELRDEVASETVLAGDAGSLDVHPVFP